MARENELIAALTARVDGLQAIITGLEARIAELTVRVDGAVAADLEQDRILSLLKIPFDVTPGGMGLTKEKLLCGGTCLDGHQVVKLCFVQNIITRDIVLISPKDVFAYQNDRGGTTVLYMGDTVYSEDFLVWVVAQRVG